MEPEIGIDTAEREAGERSEGKRSAGTQEGGSAPEEGRVPPGWAEAEESPGTPEAPPPSPAGAGPPEARVEANHAQGGRPHGESPAPLGSAGGEKWFDLRIALPEAAGPERPAGGPGEDGVPAAGPLRSWPDPIAASREPATELGDEPQAAAPEERSPGLPAVAPPEESPVPQGPSLEDLSQEIRRVGRELFKTNRAAERNQELFESTLEELRALSAAVTRMHAESADPVFLAKAALCRELLDVADALEASLAAGNEVLAQLRGLAEEPPQGLAFRFPAARRLHAGMGTAVEAMERWATGQRLLYERLMTALQSAGVKAIESGGRPFDPAVHRAVSVEQRRDVPAGVVVGEERKGYWLDGRVLRFAEVVVARHE